MTDRSRRDIDELLGHSDAVYRFLLRWLADEHLAEDLTQQTLLKAWSAMRADEPVRWPRTWLLKIAKNLVIDQFRGRRDEHPLEPDVAGPGTWDSGKRLIDREDVALAMAAMDRLPTRQRMVLYLVAVEQLTMIQISELLELSEGGVRSHLAAARRRMRAMMSELDPSPKSTESTKP